LVERSSPVGARLAREDGLKPDVIFQVDSIHCGSGLAREGGLIADQALADVLGFPVGASLLAMTA